MKFFKKNWIGLICILCFIFSYLGHHKGLLFFISYNTFLDNSLVVSLTISTMLWLCMHFFTAPFKRKKLEMLIFGISASCLLYLGYDFVKAAQYNLSLNKTCETSLEDLRNDKPINADFKNNNITEMLSLLEKLRHEFPSFFDEIYTISDVAFDPMVLSSLSLIDENLESLQLSKNVLCNFRLYVHQVINKAKILAKNIGKTKYRTNIELLYGFNKVVESQISYTNRAFDLEEKILSQSINTLAFFKENQDGYEIKNDIITFKTFELQAKYNSLLNAYTLLIKERNKLNDEMIDYASSIRKELGY